MRLIDIDALDWEEVEAKHGKRNEAVVDCETLIESAPTIGGWVPIDERLPECNGRYLVTNEAWGANEIEINVWKHGEWYYNTKPIAWMPLPDPYKEQTERSE